MIHTTRHHNKQEFKCYYQECQKLFQNKIYLVTHINSQHLHVPVFHCEICDLYFNSSDEFSSHEKKHLKKARSLEYNSYFLSKFTLEPSFEYLPANIVTLPTLPGIENDRKRFAFGYKIPISVKIYDVLCNQNETDRN